MIMVDSSESRPDTSEILHLVIFVLLYKVWADYTGLQQWFIVADINQCYNYGSINIKCLSWVSSLSLCVWLVLHWFTVLSLEVIAADWGSNTEVKTTWSFSCLSPHSLISWHSLLKSTTTPNIYHWSNAIILILV